MSIMSFERICIHCGRLYQYGSAFDGYKCPYCDKSQDLFSVIFK